VRILEISMYCIPFSQASRHLPLIDDGPNSDRKGRDPRGGMVLAEKKKSAQAVTVKRLDTMGEIGKRGETAFSKYRGREVYQGLWSGFNKKPR